MRRLILLAAWLCAWGCAAATTQPTAPANSVDGAAIKNGTITDDDVHLSAAIADTKLATISTVGKVLDTALSSNVTTNGGNNNFTGSNTFSGSPTTIAGAATVGQTLGVAGHVTLQSMTVTTNGNVAGNLDTVTLGVTNKLTIAHGALQEFPTDHAPFRVGIIEFDDNDSSAVLAYNWDGLTPFGRADETDIYLGFDIERNWGGLAEFNLDYVSVDGLTTRRPITLNVNRTTHAVEWGLYGTTVALGDDAGNLINSHKAKGWNNVVIQDNDGTRNATINLQVGAAGNRTYYLGTASQATGGTFIISPTDAAITTTGVVTGASVAGAIVTPYNYILIRDRKDAGVEGGTFTQDAWRTRDLTQEVSDTGNHASLASNKITLAAGTYEANIIVPVGGGEGTQTYHKAILWDTAGDGSMILESNSGYTYWGNTPAQIVGRFTLGAQSELEVRHYCTVTKATYGFGKAANIAGTNEVYTIVELRRIGL